MLEIRGDDKKDYTLDVATVTRESVSKHGAAKTVDRIDEAWIAIVRSYVGVGSSFERPKQHAFAFITLTERTPSIEDTVQLLARVRRPHPELLDTHPRTVQQRRAGQPGEMHSAYRMGYGQRRCYSRCYPILCIGDFIL